ncbi:MFS transporter [Phenylobacterium hankyongense]|uniref:MFS transporter n=1 Tax=Phenylobacterium hankyongense TaxID=1813876 RepID=A0A328B735_9CAUL|nr:MFS transporter [Phenylobacterium hankyongense]RAK61654.1 MFS transporter [Phenylobacterium hankyongense]
MADGGGDLAAREAAYEKFVWDNLKRNYLGNYLHGMLGMTGFRLVNAPTFLPAYLHAISGSNTIVGLGLALQQVGGVISPIFGASKIEHRTKVMPAALWMGGLARMAILGIAASGWLLKGTPLVASVLFFMLMFGIFMGAQRVVFSLLIAKVIPISRRGRLQAWRNATGGLIAAVLAYFAGRYFIGPNLFGNGYGTTFIFAFILTSMGLWALQFLLKEPEPPTTRTQGRFRDRLREFPRLITEDRAYAYFLLVQMLATSARIATPFYILYVAASIHMTGMMLGALSLAYLGADTLSNLVWGYLGDKSGFRLVLLFSIVTWIASTVLLIEVHHSWAIFLAFFGLGAAQSGYMMAAQTMILEFGARDDLPMRIAVSATAESITATLGPLLGGKIADLFGYDLVFGISIGVLVAALVLLIAAVKEPRTARMAAL